MINRQTHELDQAQRIALLSGAGFLFIMNTILNHDNDNPLQSITINLLLLMPELIAIYVLYQCPNYLLEADRIINHRVAAEEMKRKQSIEAATSNEMKLQLAGFPDHLVPDEFRCGISKLIMTKPVKLSGTPQTYDRDKLAEWVNSTPGGVINLSVKNYCSFFQFKNIGNNQLIQFPEDVHSQSALQVSIKQYVDNVIEQLQSLRQQRCSRLFVSRVELTENDYQTIHDNALKIINKNSDTAALTPSR